MQAIPLKATEREVLGKKVKNLRKSGLIPAHVYGNKVETEHVSVSLLDFNKTYSQAGETGLIDLKIGEEKNRPVLIRGVQKHVVTDQILHIDFYQVNLKEKVAVPVPIILEGDEPELVHTGEAVVIQPISEVEVEALPTELPESIIVNISSLKAIDDAITVAQLSVPDGVTILADPEGVVVKLDNAITDEMKALMEEQAAEQAANQAEVAEGEAPAEGEEGEQTEAGEGETPTGVDNTENSEEQKSE
jgi:large subunit ribosomal protein L25